MDGFVAGLYYGNMSANDLCNVPIIKQFIRATYILQEKIFIKMAVIDEQ